jgi:RHS repeat-associated protein
MILEPLMPANQMSYDGENQMASFQGIGGAASYTYDGNGLRVAKTVSGLTTTVSIYSGSSVIAEYDNGAAPGAPSREYIYNGAGDTTGLLAMISGGATTYYHQDHLSVRLTTDDNGNMASQEGHLPFGEQWYQSGPGNEWVFTNYQQDSESGLNYASARYYNSRTGTFCSADPLAGSPGDPQSWNRYPYGRNDPIDITDPSGKSWWSKLLIDVGIGIAAAFLPEAIAALFPAADDVDAALIGLAAHTTPELASIPTLHAATIGIESGIGEAAAAGGSSFSLGAGLTGAAAAQATDQPKRQGQSPIDTGAMINAARDGLSKNCDSAFRNKIHNYTKSGFFSSLASATIGQYPAGTANMPPHKLGADATTATTPGRPISLWPNFYGNPYQYQMFTLVHEGIHHFTGWSDDQVFQKFYSSGLRQTNFGTGDITNWIQKGCPPAR